MLKEKHTHTQDSTHTHTHTNPITYRKTNWVLSRARERKKVWEKCGRAFCWFWCDVDKRAGLRQTVTKDTTRLASGNAYYICMYVLTLSLAGGYMSSLGLFYLDAIVFWVCVYILLAPRLRATRWHTQTTPSQHTHTHTRIKLNLDEKYKKWMLFSVGWLKWRYRTILSAM
jgi:hypothetical protein